MADKTTSGETSGSPAALTDLIRIARGGDNYKLTIQQFLAANIISISWAALLTAQSGGTLIKGAVYETTDAPDSSAFITKVWVEALDADKLSSEGDCLITNANFTARPARIRFNFVLAAGSMVSGVYDNRDNVIEAPNGGNTVVIDRWLSVLSATNRQIKVYGGNIIGTPTGTIGDASIFHNGCGIDITSGTPFFDGTIEAGGSCTMKGTQFANKWHIGVNKTVDLSNVDSGYARANKRIDDGYSNFDITSTDAAEVNPDGSNIIDMTKFPFAGILIPDSSGNPLDNFTAFPTDHPVIVAPSVDAFVLNGTGGSGNLYLTNASETLNGASTFAFIELTRDPQTGARIIVKSISQPA